MANIAHEGGRKSDERLLEAGLPAKQTRQEHSPGKNPSNPRAGDVLLEYVVMPKTPVSMTVGQALQFNATTMHKGKTGIVANVNWISTDPSVIAIHETTGKAIARGEGTATIIASTVDGSGSGTVSVAQKTLQSINIQAPGTSLHQGQTLQMTASGQFSDNSTRDLTSTVTWTSSNTSIATVNANGLVTGVAVGPVTITAYSANVNASSVLSVGPPTLISISLSPPKASLSPGQTQQFSALGYFADGTSSDVTNSVTWSSSAPTMASISSTGLVTCLAAGQLSISASSGQVVGDASLSISAPNIKSIAVSAPSAGLPAGQVQQLTATATFSDGSTQDVTRKVTWTSSSLTVATINANGLATGGAFGATTITASYTLAGVTVSTTSPLNVLVNFTDLGDGDVQAFKKAKNLVNQLLTAFERRGNLSDDEFAQLQDTLELVTEFINNNPSTPIPNFNAAIKSGSNKSDLELLGIPFNTDITKGPIGTGSGKSNVIDDSYRAICDYLYGPPPVPGLEHDPGTFPNLNGPNPGGLTDDQLRVACVYGNVQNALGVPPPYKTTASRVTPDDNNRRAIFNQAVESADSNFRTYRALYSATLARLIQISQTSQLRVSDTAKIAGILVSQGISPANPQLNTWIDRALAIAQNAGQEAQPSDITIDLPDLEQDVSNFEIISGNIFALQPAYFCAMLEELKVFQVVEKLVELFQNGILPVVRGDAGNLLFAYWKNAALRVSEAERRGFYARSLGFPGGDADTPNRDFKDLFIRFVSATSSFVRQNTVDNLLRSNIPGAISQQQVRKTARDLATNISSHGYGIAYPMATELQKEINDVMAILKNPEIENAYGSKDVWQLVDQVAGLELGGAKNSVKYRTMASAGATIFAWLANKSRQLASSSYVPILDVAQLQNAPSYSTKPTTNPSDFDLVGACDQWLAVTGTQEDSVEKLAQPTEAPLMPSRPIQIPSVARDMLESVGVPAMAYANGKAAHTANWRFK